MGIYLFNILSIPIYRFLIKDRKCFIILVSVQMFAIMALRDITIGYDLKNYANGFQYISTLSFTEVLSKLRVIQTADLIYHYSYESGYVILNWIVAKLGCSFHTLLVLLAAFNMLSFGVLIYRYSKMPWLSFVLLSGLNMYEYAFGILRQSLAVSIVLWTIPYILKKKRLKACLIILLAFSVHRTSILFFALLFFVEKPITRKVFRNQILCWAGLLLITPVLYEKVLSKILILLGKSKYIDVDFRLNNQILLMVGIVVILYLFVDFNHFAARQERMILWGYLLSIPLEILGMCNDSFARSIEYYYIFVILLIPAVISTYQFQANAELDVRSSYVNAKWSAAIRLFAAIAVVLLVVMLMRHSFQNSPLVPYQFYGDNTSRGEYLCLIEKSHLLSK